MYEQFGVWNITFCAHVDIMLAVESYVLQEDNCSITTLYVYCVDTIIIVKSFVQPISSSRVIWVCSPIWYPYTMWIYLKHSCIFNTFLNVGIGLSVAIVLTKVYIHSS